MAEKLIIAKSSSEAIEAKNDSNIYLAGGTEVQRLGSYQNADSYISVRRAADMRSVTENDGLITIGAACTFQELCDNSIVPGFLKEALLYMGSRTRRNMATIGGNIAACRDDSYIIPALIVAGATLQLADKNKDITADISDYISDRDKYSGCLILSVTVPDAGISVISKRYSNTAQSHARLTVSMGYYNKSFAVAAAVKNTGIFILDSVAKALTVDPVMTEGEIVTLVKNDKTIEFKDDLLYGSAEYRRYLLGITVAIMYAKATEKGGLSL